MAFTPRFLRLGHSSRVGQCDVQKLVVGDEGLDGFEGGLAATGLRRGEVRGLRWRDVDFDLGQIAVASTRTWSHRLRSMLPSRS
jgi:hypothetical protein